MFPAMRLIQIVPSLEAQHGGPSQSVPALAAAFAQLGHRVQLFATTPGPDGSRQDGALAISLFHRDRPRTICASASLRTALSHSDAEIVHHHALWLRTLHYAHRHTRATGAKFVISPRGMMSFWVWNYYCWCK